MTFERDLYDAAYYVGLHPHHWFKNPPRKYAERSRDVLRVVAPLPSDRVVELGCARGDIAFLLAGSCRQVIGVDAAEEALEMAERERLRRGIANVRWLLSDVADLSALPSGSADAVAAIDLAEHVDDPTFGAMLRECRRVLVPGGRLGIYTPDRAHYVERMKAHGFLLKQFPQHIAVRRAGEYARLLAEAGFRIDLLTWSVSPFPLVRHLERALAPLPLLGPTFRYRILIRALAPAPSFAPNAEVYGDDYYRAMYRRHWFLRNERKYRERDEALLRLVRPHPAMRLLELGSARGDTSFFFAPRVASVVGIDASEAAVRLALALASERGIPHAAFEVADARDLSRFPGGAFDAVLLADFTEHVLDDVLAASLREARRVLVPGGALAVYTPNREHWAERLKAAIPNLQQEDHIAVRPAHAVVEMVEHAGFRLEDLFFSASPYPFLGALDRAFASRSFCRFRTCLRAVRPA